MKKIKTIRDVPSGITRNKFAFYYLREKQFRNTKSCFLYYKKINQSEILQFSQYETRLDTKRKN